MGDIPRLEYLVEECPPPWKLSGPFRKYGIASAYGSRCQGAQRGVPRSGLWSEIPDFSSGTGSERVKVASVAERKPPASTWHREVCTDTLPYVRNGVLSGIEPGFPFLMEMLIGSFEEFLQGHGTFFYHSPGTFLIHLRDAGEECPRPLPSE
jgi:hypothetical protein